MSHPTLDSDLRAGVLGAEVMGVLTRRRCARRQRAPVGLGHVSRTLLGCATTGKRWATLSSSSVEHRYGLLFRLAHPSPDRRSLSTRVRETRPALALIGKDIGGAVEAAVTSGKIKKETSP